MLDALHEDVNRVIDKPYVPAPEDDEESGRSDQELADEAWERHVQRNRSVIVDLFQGQLKMECRCTVCNKKVCLLTTVMSTHVDVYRPPPTPTPAARWLGLPSPTRHRCISHVT